MVLYEASKNWKHDETIIKINRESCVSIEKVFSSIFSDDLDGWNGMCFAFKRHDVTIYELNPIFIHGGNINVENKCYNINGLEKRIECYKIENLVRYEEKIL